MFKNLLSKVRNALSRNKHNKNDKKGEPKMNEKENVQEKVEKVEETDKTTETNPVDEKKSTETVEKKEESAEKTAEEAPKTEETPTDEQDSMEVTNVEPEGNGVRVQDLVTKDELMERLAAFEAKFNSVIKENNDLKEKISQMQDKYENKDFGNYQKQGMNEPDKSANSSFDEYCKNFM